MHLGWAVLKPVVAKVQVTKGIEVGGCKICELEVARTFKQIRKKMWILVN